MPRSEKNNIIYTSKYQLLINIYGMVMGNDINSTKGGTSTFARRCRSRSGVISSTTCHNVCNHIRCRDCFPVQQPIPIGGITY
jgi:hypothetical protein